MIYFLSISLSIRQLNQCLSLRHGFSSWLSRPTALCFFDGPEAGTGPLGKNPRKWLAAPPSSGLALKGCMPLDALQLGAGASRRRRRSASRTNHRSWRGRRFVILPLPVRQQNGLYSERRREGAGGAKCVEGFWF